MNHKMGRRSLLSALGLVLPVGVSRAEGGDRGEGSSQIVRFRPFEVAVREAFDRPEPLATEGLSGVGGSRGRRRVGVVDGAAVRLGVQGCHNDRAFAGFQKGALRIVSVGFGPAEMVGGVRLYVATVELAHAEGGLEGMPSRPLDFRTLPPQPWVG